MIDISNKSACCGCGACKQICPAQCVAMQSDKEGFLYPVVDAGKCVNCHRCEVVCPVLNAGAQDDTVIGCYIGYAKDTQIRRTSSSGGLFSLFAEEVLANGGVVYGAAFDDNFAVSHIRIDRMDQLPRLQGSKYLQSWTGDTFAQVKTDLALNRRVLYSGTACQIEGLKRYLACEDDYLMTIDVLCHGVPSPSVWAAYINRACARKNASIRSVNFRDKAAGWKNYHLNLGFHEGNDYSVSHRDDPFMRLFLSEACLRPSCHNCKFKHLHRSSDITLGDAWSIQKYMPDMDDDGGTSVILVHSEKGAQWLYRVEDGAVLKAAEVDIALPPSADSRNSVHAHPKREEFFERLNRDGDRAFEWWERQIKLGKLKKLARRIVKRALLWSNR